MGLEILTILYTVLTILHHYAYLVFDQHPGLIFVRDDDGTWVLEPCLSVHLNGKRFGALAMEGELGDTTLGNAPVLDPQALGDGHLGHPGDPDHLKELVIVRGSIKTLERGEGCVNMLAY